jgi:hypothetical protein
MRYRLGRPGVQLDPEGWKTFPITAKPERVASAIIKARAAVSARTDGAPGAAP